MRSFKSLLVPAILAAAVASAMAADDDGTFTISIQGPEDSTSVSQNQQVNTLPTNTQSAGRSNATSARQNANRRARTRQNSSSYRVPRPASEVLNTARPVAAASNAASANATQGNYTVGPSDTMWSIATRYLPPDRSVNEFQIVASIYRHNPNAFIGGNVNRLRAGRIAIPSLSEIARESSATGSELLERGSLQLPALAARQAAPSSENATKTSSAQQIINRSQQLPSFQATENLVKNARAERQAELEQQTASAAASGDPQSSAADQISSNSDPVTKAATQAVASANGDPKDNSQASSATENGSSSDLSNQVTAISKDADKFDPEALRIMLEGSQKQIDKRMLDINQKLMDSIERMQKANEAVVKSTDSAVASLAKQYDGMLAELQQNVTELKGELAAMDRDTANMREMILANDEKLEALQVSLADGKLGGLPQKNDYQKSYIYLIAGIGFLTLLLLSLFVFVKLKSRARKRSLQQDLTELSDENTQVVDDELLSNTVAKEESEAKADDQNSDAQKAWDKAAAEVARDEDGETNNADEADKEAKALWNKALHNEESPEDVTNSAKDDPKKEEKEAQSDNALQEENDVATAQPQEAADQVSEKPAQNNEDQKKDEDLADAWSAALAEQKAADEKNAGENDVQDQKTDPNQQNSTDQDELSKYIGSGGNEWLDNTGEDKNAKEENTSESEQVADASEQDTSAEKISEDGEVNQKDLADAWEAALAEQQAQSSTYDDNDNSATQNRSSDDDQVSGSGDIVSPKNEASAAKAATADAEKEHDEIPPVEDSSLPSDRDVQDENDSTNAATLPGSAKDRDADPDIVKNEAQATEADKTVHDLADDALSFEKAMKEAGASSEHDVDNLQNEEPVFTENEKFSGKEIADERLDAGEDQQGEGLKDESSQDPKESSDDALDLESAFSKAQGNADSVADHRQDQQNDALSKFTKDDQSPSDPLKEQAAEEFSYADDQQKGGLNAASLKENHDVADDALSFEKAMKDVADASYDEPQDAETSDESADQTGMQAGNATQEHINAASELQQNEQTDLNQDALTGHPKQTAEDLAVKEGSLDKTEGEQSAKQDFDDLLQSISNGTKQDFPDEKLPQDENAFIPQASATEDQQVGQKTEHQDEALSDEKLKESDRQADKKAFDAVMHTLTGETDQDFASPHEERQGSAEDASALLGKDFAAMMANSDRQNGKTEAKQDSFENLPKDAVDEGNVQNAQNSSLQPTTESVKAEQDTHEQQLHDENTTLLQTQDEPKDPGESEETAQSASHQDEDELLAKESENENIGHDETVTEEKQEQTDEYSRQFAQSHQEVAQEDAYLKIPKQDDSSGVEHWFVPDDEQDVPGLKFEGGDQFDVGSQDAQTASPDEDKESVPPEEHWDDLEKQDLGKQSYSPFNWTVPKEEDFDALEKELDEGSLNDTQSQGKDDENVLTPSSLSASENVSSAKDDQENALQSEEKAEPSNDQEQANLPEEQGNFSATYESSDPQTQAIVNMLAKGIPEQELEDHDESLNALDDDAVARMVSDEVPDESFGSVYENVASSDKKNRNESRNRGLSKDAVADILKRGAFKDVLKDRQ